MTREQAIETVSRLSAGPTIELVDVLSALGVLKLDEPPIEKAYDFATEALEGHGLYCKSAALKSILDRAGLKIVEK